MKKRIQRAKKLLQVQSQLLLTERLELQTLKDAMAEAQKEEEKAIALLSEQRFDVIPPSFLARRVAASAIKIKSCEALLETQIAKTLDHARKEQLVRKKLDHEYASHLRKNRSLRFR